MINGRQYCLNSIIETKEGLEFVEKRLDFNRLGLS